MQYVMVRDCYFANQARSTGGAHQRGCRYFWYINNKFISSDVSDAIFDFETTAANYAMDGLWIEGNHMLHDRPAVAVSLTGRTDTDTMKHVYFINNTLIGGGIQLGSLDGALIQGNYIEGAIDAASNLNVIVGNALLNNVRILDNTIVSDTDTVLAETGAINIRHDTGPIFCNNIEIARNKVYVLGASAIDGIRCREPQDNIRIYDNEVYGMGVATAAGIRINLTISDSTQRDNWQVNGNTVKNFPTGIAMHTSNSTTPITMQSICHNHLYSDDASMTVGILLTVAHTTANSHTLAIHGNVYGSSVTTPISMTGGLVNIISIGGGASAGGTRGPGIWQVIGTPEGMVTSVIGGVAYRTDGAANLAHYTKASGTGNTGWVPDGEVLLSSTAGVDMNTGTATTLYTVPTGFSCVITRVVVRNASTSLTTASYSFGFNSAAFDNVIANATHTELTGSTLLTVLIPKIGATVGAAAGTFKVLMNTLQGGAATTTMEVYGYLF
jgi:hypothetical protein